MTQARRAVTPPIKPPPVGRPPGTLISPPTQTGCLGRAFIYLSIYLSPLEIQVSSHTGGARRARSRLGSSAPGRCCRSTDPCSWSPLPPHHRHAAAAAAAPRPPAPPARRPTNPGHRNA
eukprot:scaffold102881_cov54-Phaeocystis_antarctica.AAC.2